MNTAKSVMNSIEKLPLGEPFTTKDFLGLGPRTSIDQSLSRLTRRGKITRLTSGIFVRPKENSYVGRVLPEPNKIVEAYAHSIGATIQVHGAEAARLFGLTTQAPTQHVYYTSGPSKQFKVGKLIFILKHVSQRKLVFAGTRIGLAISALWFLGKEHVNPQVIETILKNLTQAEKEALHSAIPSMPGWMSKAIYEYERSKSCETF